MTSAAWLSFGLLSLVASGIAACGSSGDSGTSLGPRGYDVGGQTSIDTIEALSFNPEGTVLLKPGETGYRTVIVEPASVYDVGLALLGASNDASLSKTVFRTGADGSGQFSITASSVATSFQVRASVGQLSRQLDVSVSLAGYATLNVIGNYSGSRKVQQWAATLWSGHTCANLGSTLPIDSTFTMHTAATPRLMLGDIPVGANQSIVMQGDSSIWGCRDVPGLVAGEALDLPIQVYDIPATFGSSPISANFSLATNAATWSANVASLDSTLVDAVEQSAKNDVDLMLDAMRAATANTAIQSDFDQRRIAGDWHSVLAALWSSSAGGSDYAISTALTSWLSGATTLIGKGVTVSTGLTLTSTSSSLGQEKLNLNSISDITTADLNVVAEYPLTTSSGANDGLAASSAISFNEATLIRMLAIKVARQQYPTATTIPEALDLLLQCDNLATSLDRAASSASDCNASCLSQLCHTGLDQLWQRSASAAEQWGNTKLTLSCSGTLQVDSNAVATGYAGTWVGLLSSPSGNVTTGGNVD